MTPCMPDAGSLREPLEYETMPVVRIIMSTFNGAKFLPELLTSVSQQIGVTVRWWIRDDGSSDSTREMMTDVSSHMDMHVSAGSNNRTVLSVLDLFQACAEDADLRQSGCSNPHHSAGGYVWIAVEGALPEEAGRWCRCGVDCVRHRGSPHQLCVCPVAGVGGTIRLAGQTTLDYWLGGPAAFSNVVAQPQGFESIQPLMTFFLNTARSLGLRNTSPALHAAYSAIGAGRDTNVYTIYFTYFKDHGWLGMVGLCVLLGGSLTLLWRSARRGTILSLLMYTLCIPSLLLSIQAEHFWTSLNQWIKLLVLLSLVFASWKLKARRGASVRRAT